MYIPLKFVRHYVILSGFKNSTFKFKLSVNVKYFRYFCTSTKDIVRTIYFKQLIDFSGSS